MVVVKLEKTWIYLCIMWKELAFGCRNSWNENEFYISVYFQKDIIQSEVGFFGCV